MISAINYEFARDRPIALGLLMAGFAALGGSIYGSFFKKKKPPSTDAVA